MTNLEFYREEIRKEYNDSTYKGVSCEESMTNAVYAIKAKYDSHGKSLLDWLCEEHSILKDEEKEYLSGVIKPFRDRVIFIWKQSLGDFEEICIKYDKDYIFTLPDFEARTKYGGMKPGYQYELEELGL